MNDEQNRLLNQQLESLQEQNQEHKKDIEITVTYIARLLTDLGLLTPDFKFQFSMRTLTRSVMPIITNPSRAEEKFSYLGDLRHIIEKYSLTLKKINHENEIS